MEPTNMVSGQPKMTPKFFFLSLGVLVSLITTVTAFLNLAFETLNFKFPDALNATYQYGYNSYNFDSARLAIALLIIFFPIFIALMHYWRKAFLGGLGRIDEGIRKWVIYLILFLAAVAVASDLVTLIQYFISGEMTTRFILKVVIVLAVGLFVGMHYIFELRGKEKFLGFKIALWSPIKSSVWILALIIWAFTVIGTPGQQRMWRLDDRRVQDLQSIQSQVINYWQQKQKLPEKITDLATPISYFSLPVDPEFEKGRVYEYKKTAELTFDICATFSAGMPKGWVENSKGGYPRPLYDVGMGGVTTDSSMPVSYPYPGGVNDSWDHTAGQKCFSRTIDKDMYPPYNPTPMKE